MYNLEILYFHFSPPLRLSWYLLNLEDFQEHPEDSEETFVSARTTERKVECNHSLCLLLPKGAPLDVSVGDR